VNGALYLLLVNRVCRGFKRLDALALEAGLAFEA
jgi:hypothetical protein